MKLVHPLPVAGRGKVRGNASEQSTGRGWAVTGREIAKFNFHLDENRHREGFEQHRGGGDSAGCEFPLPPALAA